MTNTLLIATKNEGKLSEFKKLLKPLNLRILSLKDFPDIGDIVEDGGTFLENALIKARQASEATGLISLADDSGLEVDYLSGEPGVHSARFAGEPKSDGANNKKLLSLLKGVSVEKRSARFKCVIAIVLPDNKGEYTVTGSCEGIILEELKGLGGFGYDPLFYIPSLEQTFAELDAETKNKISHRGQAVQKALKVLERIF